MYLKSISLVNFKSYDFFEADFSEKINCITGRNGVGKTNLLDSVYYLAFTKSYYGSIDSQNIKHGENFFVLQGKFDLNGTEENIYCGVKKGRGKVFKRNNKEYTKLSEHIGLFPLVMISPYDVNLILDGAEYRRKFVDSVISQYDKQYLTNLISYNKILVQRNKLLKETNERKFDPVYFEVIDSKLVALGNSIFESRKNFIERLLPVFAKYYNFISENTEDVELVYKSQLLKDDFSRLLEQSMEKDKILQYTTTGIHRDDIEFNLKKYSLKKTGSQGQQKTFLISLKFAQFEFIKNTSAVMPIILLDDIFDKLDSFRTSKVIELVSANTFGQIFITHTSKKEMDAIVDSLGIEDYKFFEL